MHRSRSRYLIELIIHALFWLGVYYALRALTSSSYSMVIDHGNGHVQHMDVRLLFPYSGMVLASLMLLFYSNTFWLFKKVIRFKNDFPRVMVITGWFVLLFAANFLLIRMLIGPFSPVQSSRPKVFFESRSYKPAPGTAPNPTAPGTLPNPASRAARSDTVLQGSPPNSALPTRRPDTTLPGHLPPGPLGGSLADSWSHMQLIIALVFLSVLAVAAANFFIKERIRNDLMRSHADAQQLDTEIRLLRSQVNPHFLFNTLNNLFSMAQKRGHEELADSISKLSGIMRYMIYESNTATVPLLREINYLQDCIALNKLRYADSEVAVSFSHPAPTVTAAISIAPMLFVPFLENAFKHGVSIGHHSRIDIDITVGQKKLIFTCENTDHSTVKKLEEEKGGIGLENVRRRLELVYPGKHQLLAGPSAGKYIVNLQIELA